ncbi:diguanylate cyclase domain-containing protein [Burkholderia sp. LMU1-1-1.1]|uniref:diguanylate cyclase domain-containing protein n=1 Tax=Burkholderia sp. LMU1-1-1.1 TaxID=3135266 RepID=UPI003430C7B5
MAKRARACCGAAASTCGARSGAGAVLAAAAPVRARGRHLARQGGGEFILLLTELRGADDARRVAEKIIAAIGTPFTVHGEPLRVAASVGVAVYGLRRGVRLLSQPRRAARRGGDFAGQPRPAHRTDYFLAAKNQVNGRCTRAAHDFSLWTPSGDS